VEVSKTLTPSPSPKKGEGIKKLVLLPLSLLLGEGNKKLVLLPLSLDGRGGWGGEGFP